MLITIQAQLPSSPSTSHQNKKAAYITLNQQSLTNTTYANLDHQQLEDKADFLTLYNQLCHFNPNRIELQQQKSKHNSTQY